MRKAFCFVLSAILVLGTVPSPARGEFNEADYPASTQAELVKTPEANIAKKFRVTDIYQFCGSDFCVQFLKTKFDTRKFYCFALGDVCLVRMYIRKDHQDAPVLLKMKKGDRLTVYGTFDSMGPFNFMIVDRIVAGGK